MTDHTAPPTVVVTDNPAASRYEARLDGAGQPAVATYELRDGEIVFRHTVVPSAMEGRGVGSQLARSALDDARRRGLAVIPICPFFAAFLRRHREYQDLVPAELRDDLLAPPPRQEPTD